MTIATDRTGENIAFGVTVPIISPRTSPADIQSYCSTIAQRLMAQLDAAEDDDQMSLPIPVRAESDSTFFEVQQTALLAALEMARCLNEIGYTAISCTPAAMADTRSNPSSTEVNTGYVIVATPHGNVDKLLSEQQAHPMPSLWTEYAAITYGQAAINRTMEEMQQRMRQMLAESNQPVH